MTKKKNARFWIWWNGLTKITVPHNRTIRMYGYSTHEEGWSSRSEAYEIGDDGLLYCYRETDGTDCDGRLSTGEVYACKLSALAHHYNKYARVWYPAWERVDSYRRDQYAELMNY